MNPMHWLYPLSINDVNGQVPCSSQNHAIPCVYVCNGLEDVEHTQFGNFQSIVILKWMRLSQMQMPILYCWKLSGFQVATHSHCVKLPIQTIECFHQPFQKFHLRIVDLWLTINRSQAICNPGRTSLHKSREDMEKSSLLIQFEIIMLHRVVRIQVLH